MKIPSFYSPGFSGSHLGKGSDENTFVYFGDKAKRGFYHTTAEDTVILKKQQQAAAIESGHVLWNLVRTPKVTVENQKLQDLYEVLAIKAYKGQHKDASDEFVVVENPVNAFKTSLR